MDIQSKTIPEPKFSFTAQLCQAIKGIQEKDGIEAEFQHKPAISHITLEGNLRQLQQEIFTTFQTRDLLLFAFSHSENNLSSLLSIYTFSKANGQNECMQLPPLKGKITSLAFSQAIATQSTYQIKLIAGSEDGFIKIIDFKNKNQIQTFQIDTKAIVKIKVPPSEYFSNHHICFALLEDYSIFTISIQMAIAVAHFRPTIMMCDTSLSLCLHQSMKYILQSTQGGYLVLWKINQNLYKKLENKVSTKSSHKVYNVFPTTIMHSASIQGLKWVDFVGDFIALITSTGIFKIIAINIDEKQEYAIILEYQIANGHTIKDAKILPKQECLIVTRKQGNYQSIIECIFYSPELTITHLLRINVSQMPDINEIFISRNMRYILMRNQHRFFINFTKLIEQKINENKRRNDELRSINY